MAPTLPVRAGSGRADGGNGVTIGRIGSVIEHECGLEMILASPDDLPPTAANPDEVGDLEQYLNAEDVAVVAEAFEDFVAFSFGEGATASGRP